jgi:hypothetical protein
VNGVTFSGWESPKKGELGEIPSISPIRAAVLLGILPTPHRFRSKRPLWTVA